MGYIAVHGGERAIDNAQRLAECLRLDGREALLSVQQLEEQLPLLVDRVMSEASLYSPGHAALALKQSLGDPAEASFYVRAYRSTLRRLPDSLPVRTDRMRLERRISSAFKDIPGGQILGATPDYQQRILDFGLLEEREEAREQRLRQLRAELSASPEDGQPGHQQGFRKVIDLLRDQGLVDPLPASAEEPVPQHDVTRESPSFPASRGLRLQMLARAETGGVLSLAYSSMRGYGDIHPTIAELRVGSVELCIQHPYRPGQILHVGWIRLTEVEVVASIQRSAHGGKPSFSLGYGACFGHNELKAISMAVLDRAMASDEPRAPAEDQEFVLLHTDGIEAAGFCSHFKLPHYVTFQSDLDRLRESQRRWESPDPGAGAARGEVAHR